MPRIEVLVGMIASGKSTYARKRASEGAVCYDTDSCLGAVCWQNWRVNDQEQIQVFHRECT